MVFSDTKWKIIEEVSRSEKSLDDLSHVLKTSNANISQQLRILELLGIIKKEKTGTSSKGKPRVMFSLKEDLAYIILASREKTTKKLMRLTRSQLANIKRMMEE